MLKSPYLRLAGSSIAVVGGAIMSAVTQDPQYAQAGGMLAATGEFGNFVLNIGGNMIATDIYKSWANDPNSETDLLENHDLRRLIGATIAACVLEAGDQSPKYIKSLKNLATIVPDGWDKLHDHPMYEDFTEPLHEKYAVDLLTINPDIENQPNSPIVWEDWQRLLKAMAELLLKDNQQPTTPVLVVAAKSIEAKFLPMLFEAAKRDFANRGEAYAALQMRMLGEILTALKSLGSTSELTSEIEQKLGTELKAFQHVSRQHASSIKDLIRKAAGKLDERAKKRHLQLSQSIDAGLEAIAGLEIVLLDSVARVEANTAKNNAGISAANEKLDGVQSAVEDLPTRLREVIVEHRERQVAKPEASDARRISNLHQHMFVNRLFVGRKTLLKRLHKALRSEKKAAVTQVQAIHGLGGVGKTQLALQYAICYGHEYQIVWWIRADDPSTLIVDLVELAAPLGLVASGQVVKDQDAVLKLVLGELSQRDDWLLIFDNVECQSDLQGNVPGGNGHTIITSRDPQWTSLASKFEVDVLGKTDSRSLIQNRSQQKDKDSADSIAARLGYLPLALEVAGAFCAETGMPLSEYVELLDQVGLPLLDENQPVDYQSVVSKAWQPSIEKAFAECETSRTLLGILCFVAPENFPAEVVEENSGGKLELNRAIGALSNYSLIDRNKSLLSIHRLVQETNRESLNEQEQFEFRMLALNLLNSAFPGDILNNPLSWPICDLLMPHTTTITNYWKSVESVDCPETLTRLLNQMGLFHELRARFSQAEPLMRRALEILATSLGVIHPNTSIVSNNYRQLLLEMGCSESEAEKRIGDITGNDDQYPRTPI